MKYGKQLLQIVAQATDTPQELLPGMPLIEITGTQRVLIENHKGVILYEPDCLQVKLTIGSLLIRGQGLTISRMQKHQLVITGSIEGVEFEKGAQC